MSISTIIDEIMRQLLEWDAGYGEFNINPDNLNIIIPLIKNFYKTKVMSLVEDEYNNKKKILIMNLKLPQINQKISLLKIDLPQKNIIFADVVKYVSDKMIKINESIIKEFTNETNIDTVNAIYEESIKLENTLLSMSQQIKFSFSFQYEEIIVKKINDRLKEIDLIIEKICDDEKFEIDGPLLKSYYELVGVVKQILKKYDHISSKEVKCILANKIVLVHSMYLKICDKEMKNNDEYLLILSTVDKIKDLLSKDKYIGDFSNKKETTILYQKYDLIFKNLKQKIVSSYVIPINEIIKSCCLSKDYTCCNKKIKDHLTKITFNNNIDNSFIVLIWNDIVSLIFINLINSFVEYSDIFTTQFVTDVDIIIGELTATIVSLFPKTSQEYSSHNAIEFNKIKTFINFLKISLSEVEEIKKGIKQGQFNKDFEQLKKDFELLNKDFISYYGGKTLYDYLMIMKDYNLQKIKSKKSFGLKKFADTISNGIKKTT